MLWKNIRMYKTRRTNTIKYSDGQTVNMVNTLIYVESEIPELLTSEFCD